MKPKLSAADIRDWVEERAAILEYDAGETREEAERQAWEMLRAHLRERAKAAK